MVSSRIQDGLREPDLNEDVKDLNTKKVGKRLHVLFHSLELSFIFCWPVPPVGAV